LRRGILELGRINSGGRLSDGRILREDALCRAYQQSRHYKPHDLAARSHHFRSLLRLVVVDHQTAVIYLTTKMRPGVGLDAP
jgi:hypothetical protein